MFIGLPSLGATHIYLWCRGTSSPVFRCVHERQVVWRNLCIALGQDVERRDGPLFSEDAAVPTDVNITLVRADLYDRTEIPMAEVFVLNGHADGGNCHGWLIPSMSDCSE